MDYSKMNQMSDYERYRYAKKLYLEKKAENSRQSGSGRADIENYGSDPNSMYPGQYSVPIADNEDLSGGDFPAWNKVKTWFAENNNGNQSILQNVSDNTKSVIKNVPNDMSNSWNNFKTWFADNNDGNQSIIKNVSDNTKSVIKNVPESISNTWDKFKSWVADQKMASTTNKSSNNLHNTLTGMGAEVVGTHTMSDFPTADEIHFWGRQLMEHAFFLYLGLVNPKLKDQSKENYKLWEKFMKKNFWDRGIVAQLTTIMITDQHAYNDNMVDIGETIVLVDKTISFVDHVVQVLNHGEWSGWIFPSLAKHMLKETNYFKAKLTGSISTDDEIKFINDHHSEEMGTTAQLIDPAPEQQPIIDIARSYVLKCMSKIKSGISLTDAKSHNFPKEWTQQDEDLLKQMHPTDQATLLRLSIKFSRELTEFADDTGKKIESGQLKSVISPVLAHHVHREFARFTQRLEMLQQ